MYLSKKQGVASSDHLPTTHRIHILMNLIMPLSYSVFSHFPLPLQVPLNIASFFTQSCLLKDLNIWPYFSLLLLHFLVKLFSRWFWDILYKIYSFYPNFRTNESLIDSFGIPLNFQLVYFFNRKTSFIIKLLSTFALSHVEQQLFLLFQVYWSKNTLR